MTNNCIILATNVPKIIEVSKNLTQLDKNNFNCFFSDTRCRERERILFNFNSMVW